MDQIYPNLTLIQPHKESQGIDDHSNTVVLLLKSTDNNAATGFMHPHIDSHLSQLTIIWIEAAHFYFKQIAFELIKRDMVRKDIKRLHKNNYESVKTAVNSYTAILEQANYVSINDFKPITTNYTSVQIFNHHLHDINGDMAATRAKRIDSNSHKKFQKTTDLQEWMVRRPERQLFPENYPLSDFATKTISSYSEDALSSVKKFTFSQYLKNNLSRNNSLFRINNTYTLKYRRCGLYNSLTNLSSSEQQIALQAFIQLLQAGGQIQTQQHYLLTISQITQSISCANDNLKQQLLLQIIKQIDSNKPIYLRLLCCVCYFVKPSTKIYIPLLNFLYEQANLYENDHKSMLNYCFFYLIKNFQKERRYPPSIYELYCAFEQRKIPVVVYFPKEQIFFVEAATTVQDFIEELIQFYNLDVEINYLVDINGWLMEKGLLLDELNHYCFNQTETEKWQKYQTFRGLRAVITLKNTSDINHSPKCWNIMYNYCTNQYLRGRYHLSKTDIIKIAALKMHSQVEDEENFPFSYENYIPHNVLSKIKGEQCFRYLSHILKEYYAIGEINPWEARRSILTTLSKYKGYNSHYFEANIIIESYSPTKTWVGLQKDRLIIIQQTHGRIRNICFNSIQSYGVSSTELCLKIDNIGQLHIEVSNLDVLVSVFENYLSYQASLLHLL